MLRPFIVNVSVLGVHFPLLKFSLLLLTFILKVPCVHVSHVLTKWPPLGHRI